MEDRELLELAAKACGLELKFRALTNMPGAVEMPRIVHENGVTEKWNPLEDDGDALRLSVSLQLSIRNEHVSAGSAYCTDSSEKDYPVVDSGDNEDHVIASDYAATRRAVVMAAAEIGKVMP